MLAKMHAPFLLVGHHLHPQSLDKSITLPVMALSNKFLCTLDSSKFLCTIAISFSVPLYSDKSLCSLDAKLDQEEPLPLKGHDLLGRGNEIDWPCTGSRSSVNITAQCSSLSPKSFSDETLEEGSLSSYLT